MKFLSHYSSSAGNLYEVVSSSHRRLIIDPGVTWRKLQKALNYDLSNIDGAICGHYHADHSKGCEKLLESGISVYASKETIEAVGLSDNRRAHVVEDRKRFAIGKAFECFPFVVQHDAEGSLGFVIQDIAGGEYLLYVNDTSHIRQRFGLSFSIISICCNYDKEILQARVDSGDINETFAKRLLTSHMEKEVTKSYIRDCCNIDKCTEIHLLHMSMKNADKEKIRKEFEDAFFIKTFIAGKVTRTS